MVSTSALIGLAGAALLSAACPVVALLLCRKRMKLPVRNLIVGVVVFLLFVLVLEKGLTDYLLVANPQTSAWLASNKVVFVLYAIAAAGLFEEVGRFLGMKLFVTGSRNPGAAVAYGVGHGGIEALVIGSFAQVKALVLAVVLNSGNLESMLGPTVPSAALVQIRTGLEQLSFTAALGGVERAGAFLIQIGLSLLVWRAVEQKQGGLLAAAILIHALADLPAALYQSGQISLPLVESFYTVVGIVLLAFFLFHLPPQSYRRSAANHFGRVHS